jgi:hypothetical protein
MGANTHGAANLGRHFFWVFLSRAFVTLELEKREEVLQSGGEEEALHSEGTTSESLQHVSQHLRNHEPL